MSRNWSDPVDERPSPFERVLTLIVATAYVVAVAFVISVIVGAVAR